MRMNELILYKDMEDGELLRDMTFMENYNNEYYNEDDMKSLCILRLAHLTELSVSHGFEGNLWHTYLTYLMVMRMHSTSCEIVGPVKGSINIAALHDFKIFKELFDYDFQNLGEVLGEDGLAMIRDYKGVDGHGQVFNERIRDRICHLAKALDGTKCAEEFKEKVTQFYKEFGVGKLGLHKAFRIEHTEEVGKNRADHKDCLPRAPDDPVIRDGKEKTDRQYRSICYGKKIQ